VYQLDIESVPHGNHPDVLSILLGGPNFQKNHPTRATRQARPETANATGKNRLRKSDLASRSI
jgi:hypothetical protein